ncbi:MAG: tRNA 2-thiouridine(34) synthase MnmA, partial [Fimbriimonas ginsengisoli]|nr:tRNA 2-thiouridine(34) synthase MnmA [Fimbriimonas ginsengisoli]
VLELRPATNEVVVCGADGLLSRSVLLGDLQWASGQAPDSPVRVTARIRSTMEPAPAWLHPDSRPRLEFDMPVRAVSPGQTAVAYRGQSVVAGGQIIGAA